MPTIHEVASVTSKGQITLPRISSRIQIDLSPHAAIGINRAWWQLQHQPGYLTDTWKAFIAQSPKN
jgi:hypothetical protein